MADEPFVICEVDDRGIARLTLNRPDTRNVAVPRDDVAIARRHTETGQRRQRARVVLTGAGDVFCAGGDLKGMQRQATNTREGRIGDAREFAGTLRDIDQLPKLLIGRINGSAFGGGVGLMSLCDITIGSSESSFRLTEVTLGLLAATISPYVVSKIGAPNARRMMLNALPLDGVAARQLGLLDVVVDSASELDQAVEQELAQRLEMRARGRWPRQNR